MLQSPLELLAKSWRLYRTHFWTYIGYSAWLLVPLVAFLVLTIFPAHWLTSVLAVIIGIVEVFLALWMAVCLIRLTSELSQNKTPDHSRLSHESVMRIPSVLATAVLQSLVILGGLLLFIIPGIIFWVWYCFSQITTALEGLKPVEALTASRVLTRGRFFPVLGRILAGPIIIGLLYTIVLSVIISLISMILGLDATNAILETPPLWVIGLESVGVISIKPLRRECGTGF